MDEIIIGIFKVQSDFALEVWFSILLGLCDVTQHKALSIFYSAYICNFLNF